MDYETQSFVSTLVLTPFVFIAVLWGFRQFLAFLHERRTTRNQHEFATRLLDKSGPSAELFDYLARGPAPLPEARGADPASGTHLRIVRAVQAGSVLSCLAIGFLLLGGFVPNASVPFTVVGGLGLSLGAGFLVSAYVAHRLSAKWGLLSTSAPAPPPGEASALR